MVYLEMGRLEYFKIHGFVSGFVSSEALSGQSLNPDNQGCQYHDYFFHNLVFYNCCFNEYRAPK